jgi:hypothetical protein
MVTAKVDMLWGAPCAVALPMHMRYADNAQAML